MFRWLNPRTLILASPAPPPCGVAYTLGVVLRAIGMSCEPRRASISAFVILVYATGVFSPAREAKTSNADNSRAEVSNEKFAVTSPLTLTL